jgi:hypothetical protein
MLLKKWDSCLQGFHIICEYLNVSKNSKILGIFSHELPCILHVHETSKKGRKEEKDQNEEA